MIFNASSIKKGGPSSSSSTGERPRKSFLVDVGIARSTLAFILDKQCLAACPSLIRLSHQISGAQDDDRTRQASPQGRVLFRSLTADTDQPDYALWLIPSLPAHDSARQVVIDLAKFESRSPVFSPHITLFHPISIDTPIDDITERIHECIQRAGLKDKKLPLSLNPAQSGTHYYQSVLSPVASSPRDSLSSLRKAIEAAFEWKSDKPFFPHLSLLYGDLSKERRDDLADKVNTEMALPKDIEIREIAIVDCTGTADQWRTVGTIQLGSSA